MHEKDLKNPTQTSSNFFVGGITMKEMAFFAWLSRGQKIEATSVTRIFFQWEF